MLNFQQNGVLVILFLKRRNSTHTPAPGELGLHERLGLELGFLSRGGAGSEAVVGCLFPVGEPVWVFVRSRGQTSLLDEV